MSLSPRYCLLAWLAVMCLAPAAASQTISGDSMAMKSSGSGFSDWTLNENGYLGTYITLASPGQVTVAVNASGTTNDAVSPHMNVVIADTKAGFDVGSGFDNYQQTFDLPAGTYVVRTEFSNDVPTADRELTVHSLNVSGATVSNVNSNSNALAAADTYIDNFRRGPAQVALVGAAPGSQVHVKLKNHDFLFGTAVGGMNNSYPSDQWMAPTSDPNSDAYKLQHAIVENFNAIVPGNAGKWQQNEYTRDSLYYPVLQNIFNFADANGLKMRMHNLLWDNQQPTWVNSLITSALGGNESAKSELRDEISERIGYYVGSDTDWSSRYQEVDILNEAVHANKYMTIFGADGIADIYSEAAQAAADAGSQARMYANEYNVLQWGYDDYANWYREHVEDLENAGGQVDGIGVQYYVDNRTWEIGSNQHSAARIMQTLQNLSVTGLDLSLTEFGVQDGASEALASQFLDETLRLVFGNANSTAFMMWGFWQPDTYQPAAAFYDANWNPRQPLYTWQNLMSAWDTDLNLTVGPDGQVDFDGFYGDYEITIDGVVYNLHLSKGDSSYSLVVAPGDYNGDGVVDGADYTVWRDSLGSSTDLRADGNGDGVIDEGDYAIWKSLFGTTYGSGAGSLAAVPEPASAALLLVGVLVLTCRLRRDA
jgi:GH35 family endo-1,4-beta-xylanase